MPQTHSTIAYRDFNLTIEPRRGQQYPVIVHSPGGDARGHLRLGRRSFLEKLLVALSRRLTADTQGEGDDSVTQALGRLLFDALFNGDIRSLYDVSRNEARRDHAGLRLKLRILPPELARLPWELLFDPREGRFVTLSRYTPLVRYVDVPLPIAPLAVTPPVRVLGVISTPSDMPQLDAERERAWLTQALEPLRSAGLLELTWLPGIPTRRRLQNAMSSGRWHILHFIGHGARRETGGPGSIYLTGDDDEAEPLSAAELATLIEPATLRLVVLNACESGCGGATDLFSSAATSLLRQGTPAVVSMQFPISDAAATLFMSVFYEALANNVPIDAAVGEARKCLSCGPSTSLEFATPVLHMRAPDGYLLKVSSAVAVKSPAHARAVSPVSLREGRPVLDLSAAMSEIRRVGETVAAPVSGRQSDTGLSATQGGPVVPTLRSVPEPVQSASAIPPARSAPESILGTSGSIQSGSGSIQGRSGSILSGLGSIRIPGGASPGQSMSFTASGPIRPLDALQALTRAPSDVRQRAPLYDTGRVPFVRPSPKELAPPGPATASTPLAFIAVYTCYLICYLLLRRVSGTAPAGWFNLGVQVLLHTAACYGAIRLIPRTQHVVRVAFMLIGAASIFGLVVDGVYNYAVNILGVDTNQNYFGLVYHINWTLFLLSWNLVWVAMLTNLLDARQRLDNITIATSVIIVLGVAYYSVLFYSWFLLNAPLSRLSSGFHWTFAALETTGIIFGLLCLLLRPRRFVALLVLGFVTLVAHEYIFQAEEILATKGSLDGLETTWTLALMLIVFGLMHAHIEMGPCGMSKLRRAEVSSTGLERLSSLLCMGSVVPLIATTMIALTVLYWNAMVPSRLSDVPLSTMSDSGIVVFRYALGATTVLLTLCMLGTTSLAARYEEAPAR